MLPKWHILFGALLSLALYLFFSISLTNSLIFFLASFLIDVDHYLYYVYRKKDLSLKRAFRWFIALDKKHCSLPRKERNKYDYGVVIFHGIEPVSLIFLLGLALNLPFMFFIAAGFSFHILVDVLFTISRKDNPLILVSLAYHVCYSSSRKNLENSI